MATKVTPLQTIYEVVVQNAAGIMETYETTDEHPFWVVGEGWRKAALLESGMPLVDNHDELLHVVSVTKQDDLQTVFNIQVKEFETYHIGEFGTWVHNAKCCDFTSQYGMFGKQWVDASGDVSWLNPVTGAFEKIPDGVSLSVDHVLPQNYIKTQINGFDKLPLDVQKSLINDVDNLQPMVKSANCSKGCKVEFTGNDWKTWNGESISPTYKEYLKTVQQTVQEKVNNELKKWGIK